jgi:hypothetical protein
MGKVVRLLAVKECVGSRGFIPPILSLGSTWRSVENFTPWEKVGGYVGTERFPRKEKTSCSCPELSTEFFFHPALASSLE